MRSISSAVRLAGVPRAALRVSPLWGSTRFYAAATPCLHASKPAKGAAPEDKAAGGVIDASFDFEFDPMAGVRHDAAVETAKKNIDSVIEELAPPNAPPEALAKIRTYLVQHPVDVLILHAEVQITHIENPETGAEERVHLSPMDIQDALEQAKLRKMNLVQMGSRGNELAYCRIRRERPWILKLVQAEMEQAEGLMGDPAILTSPATDTNGGGAATAADGAAQASAQTRQPSQYVGKTKPLIDHQFRDAVDAHFIGWRSKKIVQDIRKGHSVKVTIKDFQSPEAAIHKLREMCNAMKMYAEGENISYHFTSIVANDREASITFSPPSASKSGTVAKGVKHPTEKEWANALQRMEDACQKAGRHGTYMKSNKLKMRNMGASMYRVDKYGRRVS
jgi:translation initiation factor IF-3